MDEYGEIFENYIEPEDIEKDIMDVKEIAKITGIISKLKLYTNNPEELTKAYTNILFDDNVSFILTKISQNPIFKEHFPEFYVVNKYGENVINCQQNSVYHKYGVFRHILTTIEAVGNPQIPIGDWQKKILKWTMLLHDIGKPYVKTIAEDGTESFAGHDDKSVELSAPILDRFYFTREEKNIILTLIKYHDRFLNEGEITVDNMKFLASELNNNKELFYLLIDVKEADAKAKSLDVYNSFKIVKNKYLEFVNRYFVYNQEKEIDVEKKENENSNLQQINQPITTPELESLLESVLSRKAITTLYQPIFDLKKVSVAGYEVFTRIQSNKRVDILDFFNFAKDVKKYDKLQQILLINGIESFESLRTKESKRLFVNSDLESYNKYVNKPRLYDMMSRIELVIEFQNYDRKDFSEFQNTINLIHQNRGFVALDKFGVGGLTIEEINILNVDYIIPDMSLIQGIENDIEKQKYISDLVTYTISKDSNLIVIGVENQKTLETLKKLGVRYVQGYYLARPDSNINMMNDKIKENVEEIMQDTIS